MKNLQALCPQCHAQKSKTERLGAVYGKPLYSEMSLDVIEGLLEAPKPHQLVFGNGQKGLGSRKMSHECAHQE